MTDAISSNGMCEEPAEWFAMSATFGRALKAKEFLESRSVQCFIPMKYEVVNDGKQGKKRKLTRTDGANTIRGEGQHARLYRI